ncbi:dephospho-CoA kinase [Alteromonas gracilis]
MAHHIGLTGGIASGKSTVAAILRDLGCVVVDADAVAREVVSPGTPGLAAVAEAFGPGVLAQDGSLDRPALGAIVFADETARRRLEGIVHPLVARRSAELAAQAGPDDVVVHDIPLLAETDGGDRFEHVIVVDVAPQTQVDRMVGDRGWAEDDARSRMAAQASREDRLAIATHVVVNDGSLEDLRRTVEQTLAEIRADR